MHPKIKPKPSEPPNQCPGPCDLWTQALCLHTSPGKVWAPSGACLRLLFPILDHERTENRACRRKIKTLVKKSNRTSATNPNPYFSNLVICQCQAQPTISLFLDRDDRALLTSCGTYFRSWHLALWHVPMTAVPCSLKLFLALQKLQPDCLSSWIFIAIITSAGCPKKSGQGRPWASWAQGPSPSAPLPFKATTPGFSELRMVSDLELSCSLCKKIFSISTSFHIFRNNLCMNIPSAY